MTSTSIAISGLKVYGRHGCFPQETVVGNEFVVDLELRFDATVAMTTDDISATVNYAEVIELVKKEMAVTSRLIEHVAYRIAEAVRCNFPLVVGGSIRLSKPAPPVSAQLDSVAFVYTW